MEKTNKCVICEVRFVSTTELRVHLQTHLDLKDRRDFECEMCKGVKFVTKYSLLRHKLATHRETWTGTLFTCEECGKPFVCRGDLNLHVERKHEKKYFQCYFCQQYFTRRDHLFRHMKKFHILELPSFSKRRRKVVKVGI